MEDTPQTRVASRSTTSERRSSGRAGWISAVLLLLGGALLVVSAFANLGTATGPGYREAVRAPDTFEGGAFLAAGVALVVAGLVVWGPRVGREGRIVGAASLLGGGAVLWLGVTGALAVGREGARLGDGVEVALGPGLYLAMAGGALALVGGAIALMAPRDRPVPVPAPEPQVGWGLPRAEDRAPDRIEEPWLIDPLGGEPWLDEPEDEPEPPRRDDL